MIWAAALTRLSKARRGWRCWLRGHAPWPGAATLTWWQREGPQHGWERHARGVVVVECSRCDRLLEHPPIEIVRREIPGAK